MGAIKTAARQTFRDFEVDGVPASGVNEPDKAAIRNDFGRIDDTITALSSAFAAGNAVVFQTREARNADLSPAANKLGIVVADPDPALNTIAVKVGGTGTGSWLETGQTLDTTRVSDLIDAFASVSSAEARFAVLGDDGGRLIDITEAESLFPGFSLVPYASMEPRFDVVDRDDNRISWTDAASGDGGGSMPMPDDRFSEVTSLDGGLMVMGSGGDLLFRATPETQGLIDRAAGNRPSWNNARNRGLRRALAKIHRGRQATVAIVGDSIAMGYFGGGDGGMAGVDGGYYGLENGRAGSWPSVMGGCLQAAQGIPANLQSWFGGGRVEYLGPGAVGDVGNPTVTTVDPRIVLGAGWAAVTGQPTVGGFLYRSNGATTSVQFTPSTAVDRATIYAPVSFGGIDIKVNGTTVASRAAGGTAAWAGIDISFTLGTPLIEVVPQTSANVMFAGIRCWASDYGALQILNMGSAGWSTREWKATNNAWAQLNALVALGLDHYLIALGANDMMSRYYTPGDICLPAETEANLTTIVQTLRNTGASVSIALPFPINAQTIPIPDQQAYASAIRRVADRFGLLTIDLPSHFGTWEAAHGDLWADDGVHPGHLALADIGDLIASALVA